MARARKGMVYIGVELPAPDLEVIRRLARDDDRSVGSQIRIAVSTWIAKDARATLLKATLSAETIQKERSGAEVDGNEVKRIA